MSGGVCVENRKDMGDYVRNLEYDKYFSERKFDAEYCKFYADMATACKYKHDCLGCEYNGTKCMGLFFFKDRVAEDYRTMAKILKSEETKDDWDRPCPDYLADR